MFMLHVRRLVAKGPRSGALITLALCLALAGCASASGGASSGASSGTATATEQPTATSTQTAAPAGPQPTPIAPGNFTTYTNTAYGYSISYPGTWYVEGATPTSESFIVFNYYPPTFQQPAIAPPLLKVELDAVPNPNNLSDLDLFKQTASGPGQPQATIISAQATPLANDTATMIVWSSAASLYPTITYVLIPRHATTALFISQSNATGGQPSPVFTRMLASLTITG